MYIYTYKPHCSIYNNSNNNNSVYTLKVVGSESKNETSNTDSNITRPVTRSNNANTDRSTTNNNDTTNSPMEKEPFLSKISRKFRTSIVLFYGRNYLPVPYRHPIKLVAMEPIPVKQMDEPSDEYITEIQNKVSL